MEADLCRAPIDTVCRRGVYSRAEAVPVAARCEAEGGIPNHSFAVDDWGDDDDTRKEQRKPSLPKGKQSERVHENGQESFHRHHHRRRCHSCGWGSSGLT